MTKSPFREQEDFWKGEFGKIYAERNKEFDKFLEEKAWNLMLAETSPQELKSILECGCSSGRNLITLHNLYPSAKLSLIEINKESYDRAVERINPLFKFNGSIQESNLPNEEFDLVFTCGVLT